MVKEELVNTINGLGFEALVLNEKATNAQLEALLTQLTFVAGTSDEDVAQAIENAVAETKASSEEEIKALNEALEELNAKLAAAEESKTSSDDVIAEHDGKKYKVLFGCTVKIGQNHQSLTKSEIAASKEAIDVLVKTKSGALKSLED